MTDYEKEKWRSVVRSANAEEMSVLIEEMKNKGYKVTKAEKKPGSKK